jgi:hypothetical protein
MCYRRWSGGDWRIGRVKKGNEARGMRQSAWLKRLVSYATRRETAQSSHHSRGHLLWNQADERTSGGSDFCHMPRNAGFSNLAQGVRAIGHRFNDARHTTQINASYLARFDVEGK